MIQNQYFFNQRKFLFWNTLFYISWSVLALWLILKVTGVINTPIWLEYGVPIASLLIGVLALHSNIFDSIKQLAIGFATLDVKVDNIESDVGILKHDMKSVNSKVDRLEVKVDNLDKDVEFLKKRV